MGRRAQRRRFVPEALTFGGAVPQHSTTAKPINWASQTSRPLVTGKAD
jgi:hypothetical protein